MKMSALSDKIKPSQGYSQLMHLGLVVLLPIIIFIFVRLNNGFIQVALVLILLSKWRMLAVRPRYWLANIEANAVDMIVGVSTLVFMVHTGSILLQLLWAALYAGWLIALKPSSNVLGMTAQAVIGQLYGLMALFLEWPTAPLYGLVVGTGLICYISGRHFFDSFDEPYTKLLSYVWAYFAAALTWILGHWLLFYGVIAQPTLFLMVIGFGFAALYYLDHYDRLTTLLRWQFLSIMAAIIVIVLVFSNWGSKVV
jgi:hypothetical protein